MTVSTEAEAAAEAAADGSDSGTGESGEDTDTSIDGEEGGATPEEIEQVLKSTGRNVGTTAKPPEGTDEGESGEETEEEKVEAAKVKADAEAAAATAEEEEKKAPAKPEPPKPTDTTTDEKKFTLEVEDADGNKFEISKIEDLPEDFSPKTNRQGLEILSGLQKLDGEKAAYDKEQADTKATADQAERVVTIQQGWQNEFKELKITDKAEQDKVFDYMKTENVKRQEAGRPMIATVEDAKNGMDAVAAREAAVEAEKAAREEARRKGSLVGGGAAPGGAGAPPVYRGGAKNAVDAATKMGLLN